MHGPIPLSELNMAHESIFGAKAGNLGRMIQAGLRAPDGFAVAFGPETNAPLAEEERQAIRDAYHVLTEQMGAGASVAVRSSVVGEDSAEASFAGQYETFLDLDGDAAVVEAVGRCLESRESDRAVSYRQEAGVTAGSISGPISRCGEASTRSMVIGQTRWRYS